MWRDYLIRLEWNTVSPPTGCWLIGRRKNNMNKALVDNNCVTQTGTGYPSCYHHPPLVPCWTISFSQQVRGRLNINLFYIRNVYPGIHWHGMQISWSGCATGTTATVSRVSGEGNYSLILQTVLGMLYLNRAWKNVFGGRWILISPD